MSVRIGDQASTRAAARLSFQASRIHGFPQRLPRSVQQSSIFAQSCSVTPPLASALLSRMVMASARSRACSIKGSIGRWVNFGWQCSQRAIKISGRVTRAFAMHDPPLQFQLPPRDQHRTAHRSPRGSPCKTSPDTAALFRNLRGCGFLENERGLRGLICDGIRSDERHVILRRINSASSLKSFSRSLGVIRAPHRGLQSRDFVRIELP